MNTPATSVSGRNMFIIRNYLCVAIPLEARAVSVCPNGYNDKEHPGSVSGSPGTSRPFDLLLIVEKNMIQADGSPEEIKERLTAIESSEEHLVGDEKNFVLEQLDHHDPGVRKKAVDCLWYNPESDVLDQLLDRVRNDEDSDVREAALSALGVFMFEGELQGHAQGEVFDRDMYDSTFEVEQYREALDLLKSVWKNENRTTSERAAALESLGYTDKEEVVSFIETALSHPDKDIRRSGIFAAGQRDNQRWSEEISTILRSETDDDLLNEAAAAAGELQMEGEASVLKEFVFNKSNEDLQVQAIVSLAEIGGQSCFQALDDISLDHDDEQIRELARRGIEMLTQEQTPDPGGRRETR